MKSMLIIASFIAVAVAGPVQRGLVAPGMPGPAPVIDPVPIAVGPAIIDDFSPVPIAVGPAIIDDFNPVGDVLPVNPVINVPSADGTTLVQIILNINSGAADVVVPSPVEAPVAPIVPGPVNVVDSVIVPEVILPEPVVLPAPVLPEVQVPEAVIIPAPVLPEVQVPEPIAVGTPIIPVPAVVLPETLN